MQKQSNAIATAKTSRKVKTTKVEAIKSPAMTIKESLTPLGDAIRLASPFGEMLVDNLEGLTYYQKAKRIVSELFINGMTNKEMGELTDEYRELYMGLHTCIQEVFDCVHREYILGLHEKNRIVCEQLMGQSLETENFA